MSRLCYKKRLIKEEIGLEIPVSFFGEYVRFEKDGVVQDTVTFNKNSLVEFVHYLKEFFEIKNNVLFGENYAVITSTEMFWATVVEYLQNQENGEDRVNNNMFSGLDVEYKGCVTFTICDDPELELHDALMSQKFTWNKEEFDFIKVFKNNRKESVVTTHVKDNLVMLIKANFDVNGLSPDAIVDLIKEEIEANKIVKLLNNVPYDKWYKFRKRKEEIKEWCRDKKIKNLNRNLHYAIHSNKLPKSPASFIARKNKINVKNITYLANTEPQVFMRNIINFVRSGIKVSSIQKIIKEHDFDVKVLWQLRNALALQWLDNNRIIKTKNNYFFDLKDVKYLSKIKLEQLGMIVNEKLKKYYENEVFYVGDDNLVLPTKENEQSDFNKFLPELSRIKIDLETKGRLYVHWTNAKSRRVDLDASVTIYKKDGSTQFYGFNGKHKSDTVNFSGDCTNGGVFKGDGVSEHFLLNNKKLSEEADYALLTVKSFTNSVPFEDIPHTIGYEENIISENSKVDVSNSIFATSFVSDSQARSVAIIDYNESYIYHINMGDTNTSPFTCYTGLTKDHIKTIIDLANSKFTTKSLIKHGFNVTDDIEHATIVLTKERFDNFIK